MLPGAPTAKPAPDAAALIARLARPVPSDTGFTEVRFTHVLTRPLVLHGHLHYGGPGRLGRRIEAPFRENTTIRDGRVEVDRQGREPRQFDLDRAPQLRALLDGFGALLGGDVAELARDYRIELTQDAPAWSLTLVPRDPRLADHLRRLVVGGRAATPRCFSLYETDGDVSVMLVGDLAGAKLPAQPTQNALARLCRQTP